MWWSTSMPRCKNAKKNSIDAVSSGECRKKRVFETVHQSTQVENVVKSKLFMVGATGFEPATSRSRTERATKLRYAPHTPGNLASSLSQLKAARFGQWFT